MFEFDVQARNHDTVPVESVTDPTVSGSETAMDFPPSLRRSSEHTDRRQFVKLALGTAAAATALPMMSGVAAAHFPKQLDIDIEPESTRNRIDTSGNGRVAVAVHSTQFTDEDGDDVRFDPTERAVRYRFGTTDLLANGGGVRPVEDGAVEDVDGDGADDLVLTFPTDGAGLTGDETSASLYWERDESGKHGYAGSDAVELPDDTSPSDVDVLNYALSLEHLEYAFYRDALASSGGPFSEREVERSEVANYFDRPTLQYSTYQQFEEIRDQEKAHVEALKKTISDLGGTPVREAEYEFGYETVPEFVATAARLEDVGVSAYAGAAPSISSSEVLTSALSIHSVEARHASYFDTLSLRRAAPDPFDTARSMEQVLPLAKQFVASE